MVHRGGSNRRNGTRTRLLSTPAGDVGLRIPKVREGSFFPSLLEPRRRVDRALWAVITTAYVPGTSTHKVDNLVKSPSLDTRISKSTVPRICAGINTEVGSIPFAASRPHDVFLRPVGRHLPRGP